LTEYLLNAPIMLKVCAASSRIPQNYFVIMNIFYFKKTGRPDNIFRPTISVSFAQLAINPIWKKHSTFIIAFIFTLYINILHLVMHSLP